MKLNFVEGYFNKLLTGLSDPVVDIYKYAEEIGYSNDYYDFDNDLIYKITQAKNHNGKIPVYKDNKFLEFARKEYYYNE